MTKFDASHQFTCEHCGQRVPWIRYQGRDGYARDHCPFCLWSKHVSMGEEAGYPPCDAMMRGVAVDEHEIVLRCLGCGFSYRRPTDDYLYAELTAGRTVGGFTVFNPKPGSRMADPMVQARMGGTS